MGRFAEIAKQKRAEKEGSFVPLDLNEANVQSVFKNCLATPQTKEALETILFMSVYRIF